MAGLEIFGVALVVIAVVYAFFKKKDTLALTLMIVLLVLLFLLWQLGRLG
ncbi:hypothetical protein J4444_00800 [Candidatus Woesearchaeota archaeon]|nr:hypothetical protein [Candidatus Woesearchaeota archaeon]